MTACTASQLYKSRFRAANASDASAAVTTATG